MIPETQPHPRMTHSPVRSAPAPGHTPPGMPGARPADDTAWMTLPCTPGARLGINRMQRVASAAETLRGPTGYFRTRAWLHGWDIHIEWAAWRSGLLRMM